MTLAPSSRRLLPLADGGPHGSRSFVTCHYRCANACFHPEPNRTGHEHIQDHITRAVARRSVLRGAAVGAGALMVGTVVQPGLAAAAVERGIGTATFAPIAPNKRDAVVVPDGFRHDVLVRWGDPVVPGAPPFDPFQQTPESAAMQFGYNCDYVGVLEFERQPGRALLVVNNEYTNPDIMFPADAYDSATQKRIEMASHGMSIVTLKRGRTPGAWLRVAPTDAPPQPTDHRQHPDARRRPRGG